MMSVRVSHPSFPRADMAHIADAGRMQVIAHHLFPLERSSRTAHAADRSNCIVDLAHVIFAHAVAKDGVFG